MYRNNWNSKYPSAFVVFYNADGTARISGASDGCDSFVKPGFETYCAERVGGVEHVFGLPSATRSSRNLVVVGTYDKFLARAMVEKWVEENERLEPKLSCLHYNELTITSDNSGAPIWDCRVVYSYVKFFEASYTVSFTTTATTSHIDHSLHTQSFTLPGFSYRDHNGMIGYNGNGEYEGVDIKSPTLQLVITENRRASDVDMSFVKKISDMTGKTNESYWFKFPPGCAMYEGCSGEMVQYDSAITADATYYYRLSHTFSFAPSIVHKFYDVGTGDLAKTLTKAGWDYFWVEKQKIIGANGKQCTTPRQIHVERVYERGDFSEILSLHGSILDPTETDTPLIPLE